MLLYRVIASAFTVVAVLAWAAARPCSAGAAEPGGKFTDPFAYCAAVGTVDAPDGRYSGPALPEPVVRPILRLGLVSPDAPQEIIGHAAWRCMSGKVLVCHFGNNIPCLEKADISRVPTAAMKGFCRENPASDVIPAYVTGRATVYQWRCANGVPEIVRQLTTPDARGFLAEFWHEVRPE